MMRYKSLTGLLFVCLILGCCQTQQNESTTSKSSALTASHEEAETWAQKTLDQLSLKEKIGQMICEQMRGDIAEDGPESQKLIELIQEHGIGAFVLYGGSPVETAKLLNQLQKESKLPLFISADFEGGPGQQFAGATEFPANMALSAIGSDEIAYQTGKVGAKEGRAIGIHITYSPVVDILTLPENPAASVRSFGTDLELLGRLAGAYIRGYQENGMLATAKHYPGRGDVELIPGTDFTIINKSADRVVAEEFYAFKQAIDAGVVYIMTEHIAIPSVTDGSDLPASVERKLIQGWLREKMDFQGIITTDDMWYEKVTLRFGPVQACVMAIQAGHDAILKPANAVETIQGLIDAVNQGKISEEQINRSVKRILYWKARLNLHQNRFVDVDKIPSHIYTQEHKELQNLIADSSLTLLVNKNYFPKDLSQIGRIAHISAQKRPQDPAPETVAAKLDEAFPDITHFFLGAETETPETSQQVLDEVRKADTIVVSLFNQRTAFIDNGPLKDKHLSLLLEVITAKPNSTVVMSYGNPFLVQSLKQAAAFLVGYGEGGFYGNQTIYVDSFIRLMQGKIIPKGKLPVYISAEFPLGHHVSF